MQKQPNSRKNLDLAIERAFGRGATALRTRTLIADVVAAQMLPSGMVKGEHGAPMSSASVVACPCC